MKPLDLRKLQHAITLQSEKNFIRASERLHLTQSALTRSIQALESELGVQLFERDRSGLRTTAEGAIILKKAKGLLLQSGSIQKEVELIRQSDRGEVSFGVGPAMAGFILPKLFSNLSNRPSKVSVTTEIGSSEQLISSLLDEKIEFLVSSTQYLDINHSGVGISLAALKSMPTGLFVSSGHPLAQQTRIDILALQDYPFLMPNLGRDHLSLLRKSYGDRLDIEKLKYIMCNDFEALKSAMLNSDGVVVALAPTLEAEIQAGTVKKLDVIQKPLNVELDIHLAYIEGRRLSLAGQLVLGIIKEILGVDKPIPQQ